jgi:hypothetical protein
VEAVISAMVTTTKKNVFEFGGLYFLQLMGTTMGRLAAIRWATLYYAYTPSSLNIAHICSTTKYLLMISSASGLET